ncbi:SirB2 family protein [Shewanella sedimentimangrovi]|uniref:SirB2 family protein n=1 Tax=Shewanella sedimentimangrovi TaxID=2814293 RepID=A0ABX7R3R1_9GAMM|nr:SirB2 family protein [Shewanella sedimentimangrovi]QSX37825.1 SirB2 family protein [Shewanella sedimentimangrovi]
MYPILLKAHLALVALAFLSFLLRTYWGLRKPVMLDNAMAFKAHKLLTLLMLLSAFALCIAVGQYPVADAWLTEKLALLVIYVGFAMAAFRPRAAAPQRLVLGGIASGLFVLMLVIAKTHSPLLLG